MDKRLGALTLGVRDLACARRFYEEGLGWTRDGGEDDIAFYQLNGLVLGLYEWPKLAADAAVDPNGSGFRGVSLAYCVRERDDLERVLVEAEAAGATILVRARSTLLGRPRRLLCRSGWTSVAGAMESPSRDHGAR